MLHGWWICCKFTTTLLQSKQWCFDNKGNKWKQVFFMTSMYCFITDWFCSFFTFKLVKLRWFLGSKSRCKLKWRSKSQQHFWPKIWCFKKPLQFCQNIPPLEEENHLHIAFFRGYDSFMECLSRCLLLLKIFSHIGKNTCVVNFNQAPVLVRSNQLLPPIAPFSRCVRWWPIILSFWVWLMHMAFQPYIMPWCRVTLSSFPRCLLKKHGGSQGWFLEMVWCSNGWKWLGESTRWPWSPSWNAMMCDSHRPIRYCVCKGDIANRLSKSYKSPQF